MYIGHFIYLKYGYSEKFWLTPYYLLQNIDKV
jgi:hypothetical protein